MVYLSADGVILQRREADAETVERDYYWFGFSEGVSDYFYTRDHLGSVREVIAGDGVTLESRYDYDLWGNVTRTDGTGVESDFRYTGHFYHGTSKLHLAQYRAYDSELGRWISRDPAWFIDGPNLYSYVLNNPVLFTDPTGLSFYDWSAGFGDSISFGATEWIRKKLGVDHRVDKCSDAYQRSRGAGDYFDLLNPKGWLKAGYKVGIKSWAPDIFKKLKQFSKLPIKKQKKRYKDLKKTYQYHLKKYNQTPGKTTGETNRMERELREMEDILRNRGVDLSDL